MSSWLFGRPCIAVSSLEQLFRLLCLALVSTEKAKVIDSVEGRYVLWPRHYFMSSQPLYILVLCLFKLALDLIEVTDVVDGVEGRCIIWSKDLLTPRSRQSVDTYTRSSLSVRRAAMQCSL
jgi:hypothetical protein